MLGFIKQGQRRDVWAQHRDMPEGLLANVATLRPTSRRDRESINPIAFPRRDVTESGAN